MAFITCGVLHICEYPRNFLSNRALTILIPFPNSLHKRRRAVNRFVKNGKANFGSPIEGNPKYSGEKKPKWIFHLTSTEISGVFGLPRPSKKNHVSRPDFYKKESGRAVFFYLLFPIACFLYTLLPFPRGYVGALRSNINKTKHQILIKYKFV